MVRPSFAQVVASARYLGLLFDVFSSQEPRQNVAKNNCLSKKIVVRNAVFACFCVVICG